MNDETKLDSLGYFCSTLKVNPKTSYEVVEFLNKKASEGWELFHVTTYPRDVEGNTYERFIFRLREGFGRKIE